LPDKSENGIEHIIGIATSILEANMEKAFFILGALSGALAVMLGAFGAHALRERLTPQLLDTFETGVRYEMYHALAIMFVAFALTRWQSNWIPLAGWWFVVGTLLFSGSLYLLALTGQRWLGAVTPFGGIAFIAGWILLAVGVWQGQ
jgi:uncharacterized membrane protein YgdD (TMEM256/DUF423 family)